MYHGSSYNLPGTDFTQAQKFGALADSDDDDVLDEDSLLETPLDKVEPYGMFRDSLISKTPVSHGALFRLSGAVRLTGPKELQQEQLPLYESLTKVLEPADQQILQGVIHEAEIRAAAAQQAQAQAQMVAAGQGAGAPPPPAS